MYSIQLSMMNFRKIVSITRTMVDYQNTMLTKTEISEKLFGVCKWSFHHLLIRGCLYDHYFKWLILKLVVLNVNFGWEWHSRRVRTQNRFKSLCILLVYCIDNIYD